MTMSVVRRLPSTLIALCLYATLLAAPGLGATEWPALLSYKQILARDDRPMPDHKIAYGEDASQFGELWLPAGKGPHPVVLMIHGGCWLASLPGPELLAYQADALRRAGLAVWSISYRRNDQPGGAYPGTFLDVARGADKLRELAEKYPLDLSHVVATGHSAGGHLALWAAARPNIAADSPLKTAHPLPIAAVVSLAGVPDLAYGARMGFCDKAIDKLVDLEKRDGKGENAPAWKDTSPMALLPLRVRQTLVHGVYDAITPPAYGYGYRRRAAEAGDTVDIVNVDEAGHFELISPWTATGRRIVDLIVTRARNP
jgi:acetyl esterase/lipase